jgi:hypothetical protein
MILKLSKHTVVVKQFRKCVHGVQKGGIAFEAVGSASAHLIKEVVEGDAENKYLKNLREVSKS